MKALLQQIVTGLYFQDATHWTAEHTQARDFRSSVTARNYSVDHGITDVQIVLKFEQDRYDIVLPVFYPVAGNDAAVPRAPS